MDDVRLEELLKGYFEEPAEPHSALISNTIYRIKRNHTLEILFAAGMLANLLFMAGLVFYLIFSPGSLLIKALVYLGFLGITSAGILGCLVYKSKVVEFFVTLESQTSPRLL